jgi:hypothetical protein
MQKIEKIFLFLTLGGVAPLVGFLAVWFVAYQLFTDWKVFVAAVCGGLVGLVVDAFLLKRWVEKAYLMDWKIWMAIFVFYSFCMLGFFMGVPVVNLALAVAAGFYVANRLAHQSEVARQDQQLIYKTKVFTTFTFGLVCVASAAIALIDPYTADNLEGMFGLPFELTIGMIVGLIVVGGAVVIALNWWLMAITIQLTQRWMHHKQS